MDHWFWLLIVGGTLAWYVIVTVSVGVKGYWNIREMLEELDEQMNSRTDEQINR